MVNKSFKYYLQKKQINKKIKFESTFESLHYELCVEQYSFLAMKLLFENRSKLIGYKIHDAVLYLKNLLPQGDILNEEIKNDILYNALYFVQDYGE